MPPMKVSKPPTEPGSPYTPPGPPPLVFEQFQGMETSTTRPGVKDEQAWWLDTMMPIGPRALRAMPGLGARLWGIRDTIEPPGAQISFFDFANIGSTPWCIVILSDGSVYAVNTVTRTGMIIAPFGTIQNPSRLTTGLTQYGSQYVIIVTSQANGYFIWDGSIFYSPGDPSPTGGTMPTGISGTAVEIYAGRVWIANGATLTFSVAGSIDDFTSGNGGGQITSSDSFLRIAYVQLVQSNGFLYLIGDSSVNYISGVQTSGSPPVTTFTNQNADAEVGSPWPGSVKTFGRNIIFANSWGVHVSYGAAVSKISESLDGIYSSVPTGNFLPSAAKAIIFGKRVWMLLLPIIDPLTGQQVIKFLLWNGKVWFAATQDLQMIFIQHQELASVLTSWGTDGTDIYPLFTTPSTGITKVAMTKLWDNPGYEFTKTSTRLYGLLQYFDIPQFGVNIRIDNESGGTVYPSVSTTSIGLLWYNVFLTSLTWINNLSQPIVWGSNNGAISSINPIAVAQTGRLIGMTFFTDLDDFFLISLKLQNEISAGRY